MDEISFNFKTLRQKAGIELLPHFDIRKNTRITLG